jgi:hypothetical protein
MEMAEDVEVREAVEVAEAVGEGGVDLDRAADVLGRN